MHEQVNELLDHLQEPCPTAKRSLYFGFLPKKCELVGTVNRHSPPPWSRTFPRAWVTTYTADIDCPA